jgi:glycolate oxidase iron-sulfur subunit
MQHTIPLAQWKEDIGPQAEGMAKAVETCVHCGFCLPTCPTYQVLGEEMDSPRGRIVLMKSVLEGSVQVGEAIPYIDRCLGCLACTTACPSGVEYAELVLPFRAFARSQVSYSYMEKARHALVNATLPNPKRFHTAATLGRLARPFHRLLPESLRGMIELLPEKRLKSEPLPELVPAQGEKRGRVALLVGCVQQALAPEINQATLRVLALNGVEVLIPPGQGCCGAILTHTGEVKAARDLARRNFNAFPSDVDVILTNAAGCGSGMKEYPSLFAGQEDGSQVRGFAQKVRDVSEYLMELGLLPPPPLPQPMRVAYHDACHLAHAQHISDAPRQLLASIPNLTLVEIADGSICCGSAGTYNLEQPDIARELGRRKAENILASSAEAVVMGNIGCMVQIRNHLSSLGKLLPVFHTMELLDLAYSQS